MTQCELPDNEPRFKRFKYNKFIIGICVIMVLLFLVGIVHVNKAIVIQSAQMDNIHDAEFLRENGYHVSGVQKVLFFVHTMLTVTLGLVAMWALGSRNYYYKKQRFLENIITTHGTNGIIEEKNRLETEHAQQLQGKRGLNVIRNNHKLL